ncbi:hypothetical protein [Merismopedia glauca]|uniref:Uncharacterized protein n=1 Tax=Merismopedia glauca CCAP 1448/3 TaxID=1296344 RepID=A0A2T1BZD9_9CYAN|nr:hypothetical protein [Merismopedia glauca]PSB01395.1 hypothetical protein C7B64_18575 [Merismopedia glauca CCAP 1448/3]
MPSSSLTVEITVPNFGTIGYQIPNQLSSQQQQDLNDWYDVLEQNWLDGQQYYSDRYLYDDKI